MFTILISGLAIGASELIAEKAVHGHAMRDTNQEFVTAVNHLQPGAVASLFYQDLYTRGIAGFSWVKSSRIPAVLILCANLPFALVHTFLSLVAQIRSIASAVPVVVFLASAAFAFLISRRDGVGQLLGAAIFTTPLFSIAAMWVLQKIMLAGGALLGWLFAGAEMVAGATAAVPFLGWLIHAVVADREHWWVHKIVSKLPGEH